MKIPKSKNDTIMFKGKETPSVRGSFCPRGLPGERGISVVHGGPAFSRDGSIIGFIQSIRDISDRKKAEQELRLSEERFRVIFESAQDCIYLKDRSFRYVLVNPAMEKLFGIPAEQIIGSRRR